jgi:hypothetical protein
VLEKALAAEKAQVSLYLPDSAPLQHVILSVVGVF